MKFGPDYCEDVEARGEPPLKLRLRTIRPEHKELFRRGLARMSPQSQYTRFFTSKPSLTDKELAYLTEVDGYNHFAIGGVELDEEGREGEGVGVARFVRLPGEEVVAEPAVVVLDDMQNRGIGTILMKRLVEAAKERDVEVFRSEFLARNAPVKQLLEGISPHIRYEGHGTVVTAEIPLRPTMALVRPKDQDNDDAEQKPFDALVPMLGVLRMVAEQGVELRRRFSMLFDPETLLEALREFRQQLMNSSDDSSD